MIAKKYIDYILVYVLLFVSGTWRFNLSPDKMLVLGFIFVTIVWFVFSDRKISDRFLLYATIFTGLLVALSLYTAGSLSLTSIISSTMKLLLAYLVIRTVGDRFVDVFLAVLVFIAAFSLFGYLTDIYGLFDGLIRKLPRVGYIGYEGFFYLYRFPWHIERNNSIFYEPGAYQAFLNAGLFILLFAKLQISRRKRWIYAAVLMMALITTFSTTGFLIFALMFSMFIVKSNMLSFQAKVKVVAFLAIAVSTLATQFYSTVVVKVEEYLTASEYDTGNSAKTRSSHAKTDWKLFKEHVFGLGHRDYQKEFLLEGRIDPIEGKDASNASSNGVTKALAVYGLPYSLFMFGSYFWALKRLVGDVLLGATAFVMFMMFLAGESYYLVSPICFAIIAAAFVFQSERSCVASVGDTVKHTSAHSI